MDTLLAPNPTASLGGYEWRLHELLQELNSTANAAHKATIRRQMKAVADNFQLAHPGKELVLAPCPFDFPHSPTMPGQNVVQRWPYILAET